LLYLPEWYNKDSIFNVANLNDYSGHYQILYLQLPNGTFLRD
jgi:hypothetical protein